MSKLYISEYNSLEVTTATNAAGFSLPRFLTMRRFLIGSLLTLALLFHSTFGYSQGLMTLGAGSVRASVGGGLDPATTAWVNQVVTNGGTVSTTRQTVVNTFITCLKSNSLFSTLDRYWLLAGENTQSAQYDLIHASAWTSNGTVTFSANNGYTGDGSTGYLDTNYTPSTGGGNYALNSASIFAYVLTSRTTNNNYSEIGTDTAAGTAFTTVEPVQIGTVQGSFAMNGASSGTPTTTNARASFLVSVTASNANAVYKNGTSINTGASAPSALSNTTMVLLADRVFGNPNHFSADQVAAVGFGGGMNATQAANFETCQNTMMGSIGIAVH